MSFRDSASGSNMTTVRAGDTVQWVWAGASHSSTSGACCSGDGVWDSGVRSSGTFSHTFAAAGTFPYFCTVHGSAMTGTVIVTP
jgi:plastocyanin